MDADGAIILAEALSAGAPLTMLSVDNNAILDEGASALAKAIGKTQSLTDVSLNACSIGTTGVVSIAAVRRGRCIVLALNRSRWARTCVDMHRQALASMHGFEAAQVV